MTFEQKLLIAGICWLIGGGVGWFLLRRFWQSEQAINRLAVLDEPIDSRSEPNERNNFLSRYMRLAGLRQSWAPVALVVAIAVTLGLGLTCAFLFRVSGLQQTMLIGVESIPGGLAGVLVPVVLVAPWLTAVLIASAPIVYVRAVRRQRVEQVNRDMPLALDLWATLAEGGLGFDAALDRWLNTQRPNRALASEARRYQRDLLAGMRRVKALRRWSERLSIPVMNRFAGAMIQSEQSGSNISETLRLQAEDTRAIRREKSLTFAQSLATKRIIPLVICFLPGLFVWPLGPFFIELFRIVDQLTGTT